MQLLDIFLQKEEKYDLYQKKIGNINYWVYSRFAVYHEIDKRKNNLKEAHKRETTLKQVLVKGCKILYYSYLYSNKKIAKADVFVVNHPRRIRWKGLYECPYSSLICSKLEDVFILERGGIHDHFRPILEKEIFYADRIALQGSVVAELNVRLKSKRYKDVIEYIDMTCRNAINSILEEVGLNVSAGDKIIKSIAKNYFVYQYKYDAYKKILKKVKPKVIVEVVSYSADCMAINQIAKEMGIPTIELQHGVMDSKHIAYNYGGSKNIIQFPDYELVFSEYWKKVTAAPIDRSKIIPVGYPFFDRGIRETRESVGDVEKRGICFISQGNTGDKLSRLALELSKVLNDNEWVIYYKLHPGEFLAWKESYPWLVNSNVNVIDGKGMSLYEVFARSEYQVGVSTTAIYEGFGFGLKTLIYRIYLSEYFETVCSMGYAQYVESANEIKEIVENNSGKKGDVNKFWEEDALNKAVDTIKDIMRS